MLSHFITFSGEMALNCCFTSAAPLVSCSVNCLWFRATPTMKSSLKVSFRANDLSAEPTVAAIPQSAAVTRPLRHIRLRYPVFICGFVPSFESTLRGYHKLFLQCVGSWPLQPACQGAALCFP